MIGPSQKTDTLALRNVKVKPDNWNLVTHTHKVSAVPTQTN